MNKIAQGGEDRHILFIIEKCTIDEHIRVVNGENDYMSS